MFSLEKISRKIITALLGNTDLDQLTKAKAEYGLSLLMGIAIEMFFCLVLAGFLDLFWEVFLLMAFSLVFRVFAGGAHCSSYLRCLVFTIFFYLFFAYLAKYICFQFSDFFLYIFSLIFLFFSRIIVKNISPPLKVGLYIWVGFLLVLWFFNINVYYIFFINLAILLQTLMGTETGGTIVQRIDMGMKKIGI